MKDKTKERVTTSASIRRHPGTSRSVPANIAAAEKSAETAAITEAGADVRTPSRIETQSETNIKKAGAAASGPSLTANRYVVLYRVKFLRADALDVHQILGAAERAVRLAVGDYRLTRLRPDSSERVELAEARGVYVDFAGGRRRARCGRN